MPACPDDERLTKLLHAELDETDAGGIETHLEHCSECQARFDALLESSQVAEWAELPNEATGDWRPVSRHGAQRRAAPTDSASRYEIQRFLAKGALGEVHVANDQELQRHVALKQMQSHCVNDAVSRGRFTLEARVTGSLEHPGIVPVYGSGVDSAGRPFYAMRLIRGETLKQAIANLYAGESKYSLRNLLLRFVSVCNTVAYAHSRGVLHRDLKPNNIMLGPFGETLVVDWGMAKRQTSAGEESGTPDLRREVSGAAERSELETRAGQVLGTIAYMSPEQANGVVDELGPATDIYSLGAILYTLLTGKTPFRGEAHKILPEVRKGHFPKPRDSRPNTPRGLEAICLKATSLKSEERYGSALALAADVERWLADEPVTAYRDPVATRISRWARRNQTVVASAVVLGATSIVALGVGLVAVERERGKTVVALTDEAQARAQTKQALDTMTDEVIERLMASQAEFTEKDRAFLRRVEAFYEDLVTKQADNPRMRAAVADGYLRVARVRFRLDDVEQAEASVREALQRYQALADENPDDVVYQEGLADSNKILGDVFEQSGRIGDATAAYQEAAAILDHLSNRFPEEPSYRSDLANCYTNLGVTLEKQGQLSEAMDAQVKARDQMRQILRESDEPEFRSVLSEIQNNVGILALQTGQNDESVASLQNAVDVMLQLCSEFPENADYRHDLASSITNLGICLGYLEKHEESQKAHQEALEEFRKLTREFPLKSAYQLGVASSLHNAGESLVALGQSDQAEEAFSDAADAARKLVDQEPNVPQYRLQLSNSLIALATLKNQNRKFAEARQLLDEARTHLQEALRAEPDNPLLEVLQQLWMEQSALCDSGLKESDRKENGEKASATNN